MVYYFSREMDEGTGIIDNQVNNNLQHDHSLSFVLVKGPCQIDRQFKGIECCMQSISFISALLTKYPYQTGQLSLHGAW